MAGKYEAAKLLAQRLMRDPERYVRGDMYRKSAPHAGIDISREAKPTWSKLPLKERVTVGSDKGRFLLDVYPQEVWDDPRLAYRDPRDVGIINASVSEKHGGGGQKLYDATYDLMQDEGIDNLVTGLTVANQARHPLNNIRQGLRTEGKWFNYAIPANEYIARPADEAFLNPTERLATLLDASEQGALQRLKEASTGRSNKFTHWKQVLRDPYATDDYKATAKIFLETMDRPDVSLAKLYDPEVPALEAAMSLRGLGMGQVGPTTTNLLRALEGIRRGDDRLLRGLDKNFRKGGLAVLRDGLARRSSTLYETCPCEG